MGTHIILDLINGITQSATGAIGVTTQAVDAVKAVSALLGASELGDDEEIKAALVDLQHQVMDAKIANAVLKGEIAELREAALQVHNFQKTLDRYELVERVPGKFVLALKEGCEQGEPFHYLCHHCTQRGERIILQSHYSLYVNHLQCPSCEGRFGEFGEQPVS